ncbi:MAG: N-acetylmuramoyl-L-alanine amidase [Bacteroidales bacterium]|nr:N-acetylmuramoyl-L-alanine amidase [Bacteroidales bacterium]
MKHKIIIALILILALGSVVFVSMCDASPAIQEPARKTGFREVPYPSNNYDTVKVNEVKGVILHHTAESTLQRSLDALTSEERGVSAHIVIDTDGTRYLLVDPERVAWHAGFSLLHGREKCNDWTLGIEFQGNTLEQPLTQDQIDSAIEWLLPLIAKYDIPVANIVTHEMIRTAYKKAHPESRAYDKPDITPIEYKRFMAQLHDALGY